MVPILWFLMGCICTVAYQDGNGWLWTIVAIMAIVDLGIWVEKRKAREKP